MNTTYGTNSDVVLLSPPLYNLSAKDTRYYLAARKAAALSNCRYKVGAVIVRGSNIISSGNNTLKTHSKHIHWPNHVCSVHAEHNVIRHAQHRNIDLNGATIYVARIGGLQISKPCNMCMSCIRKSGIRTIVYSNGTNLVKMRI